MKKITILISGFLLFFLGIIMIPFPLQAKGKISDFATVFKHSWSIQDKNLIKGNWQRDDAAVELQISRLLKNGALEVRYLNSKLISVEKAGWTDSSDVFRIFVIYRQDDKSGYSLSLNYMAERDLLIGVYVDGSDNKSYNVTFKRIK